MKLCYPKSGSNLKSPIYKFPDLNKPGIPNQTYIIVSFGVWVLNLFEEFGYGGICYFTSKSLRSIADIQDQPLWLVNEWVMLY